jgi:hypothetical protein
VVAARVFDVGRETPIDDHRAGPVAEALSRARRVIDEVAARPGWALAGDELLDGIRSAQELSAILESLRLGLLAELQSRPELIEGAAPGKAAVTFLTTALRVSRAQATRDATAAAAVNAETGDLPRLGAALAEGRTTREHVDVAVAAVRQLPAAVKKIVTDDGQTGLQLLDGLVTDLATTGQPGTIVQVGKDLLMAVDPDRACHLDQDAVTRRSGSYGSDFLGMGVFRFTLDPATYASPDPAGTAETLDGQQVLFRDQRTRSQRIADAFATMARVASGGSPLSAGGTTRASRHPNPTHNDHRNNHDSDDSDDSDDGGEDEGDGGFAEFDLNRDDTTAQPQRLPLPRVAGRVPRPGSGTGRSRDSRSRCSRPGVQPRGCRP